MSGINEITDHLYLSGVGPLVSVRGKAAISKMNITHVLTVTASRIAEYDHINGVEYRFIYAVDLPNFDILSRLTEGVHYMEEAIENGGDVLVHCEMGISRSATFVAAYVMKKFRWSAKQAVTHINRKRPIVQPNEGFMEQLQIFQSLDYLADPKSLSSSELYQAWCKYNGLKPVCG